MLELSPSAQQVVNSAVLISGTGRSGTTILGKLIHSFERVEYLYEPPTLIALFSIIGQMPAWQWKFLYEAYLYEEFLVNAVCGRAINTNRADDSSIHAVKGEDDVAQRLGHSWRKSEAALAAADRVIAYKIPNIVPFIAPLLERYPATTLLIMKRGALETLHSLIEKKWFSDDNPNSALPWPFRERAGRRVPYWVADDDTAMWLELGELDRCAYYYIRMSEAEASLAGRIEIRYAELLSQPHALAATLAERLGVRFGPRTEAVLASIKPTGKRLDAGLLGAVSDVFRPRLLAWSARAE